MKFSNVMKSFDDKYHKYMFKGALAIALPVLSMSLCSEIKMGELEKRETSELSTLVEKAVGISAGPDRIWQDSEKREFLDKLGLKQVIGQGQDVYFRPKIDVRPYHFSGKVESSRVDVGVGYNLENNGRFLHGSTAKSGTLLGEVSKEKLQEYIGQNQK